MTTETEDIGATPLTNQKHEAFVNLWVAGANLTRSYEIAYQSEGKRGAPQSGSRLAQREDVQARARYLRRRAAMDLDAVSERATFESFEATLRESLDVIQELADLARASGMPDVSARVRGALLGNAYRAISNLSAVQKVDQDRAAVTPRGLTDQARNAVDLRCRCADG